MKSGCGQPFFQPVVMIFTISNLLTMGLQANIPQLIKKLPNPELLLMICLWAWVVGPAIAFISELLLPLPAANVMLMCITSLTPCAPFLLPMIRKARGVRLSVAFAGAFIPLAGLPFAGCQSGQLPMSSNFTFTKRISGVL